MDILGQFNLTGENITLVGGINTSGKFNCVVVLNNNGKIIGNVKYKDKICTMNVNDQYKEEIQNLINEILTNF